MHLKARSKGSVEMNASTTAIRKNHVLPIAIVLFAAAAAIAAFALTATANAGSSYNSSLGSNRPAAEKVSSSKVAAYTSRAARARARARAIRLAKARRRAALRRARAAAAAYTGTTGTATTASTTSISDGERAQQLLTALIAQHPILAGATVEMGNAQGYQAISYFQTGRIVISPTHTASIDRIMNHEIWHIIDWRDNGRIDWGENVPPAQ